MDNLEFLTVKEFAAKMKVRRDLVYEWIDYGRIKAIRLSDKPTSQWRIPYAELRRMHAKAYEIEDEDD